MSEEATKQVIEIANLRRKLLSSTELGSVDLPNTEPIADTSTRIAYSTEPKLNLVMPKRPTRLGTTEVSMPADSNGPGPDARVPIEKLDDDEVPAVYIDSSVNNSIQDTEEDYSSDVSSATPEIVEQVVIPKRRGRPPKVPTLITHPIGKTTAPTSSIVYTATLNATDNATAQTIEPAITSPIEEPIKPICDNVDSSDYNAIIPEVKSSYVVQVQQEVHAGKTVSVASLRFVGTPDATRVMELNLTPSAKMTNWDIKEFAAYKAQQYEHDITQWGELADIIIREIDSIPPINYNIINNEIESSSIEIKPEPSMHDCALYLAEINNRLSRLGLFKIRLTPIMSIYDTGKSLLSDTWSAISQKSSEGAREGEAKLILSRFILEYKKIKALWDTLDMAMKRLEMSWQTVSRQITAIQDDNVGSNFKKPVDIGDGVSSWDYMGN